MADQFSPQDLQDVQTLLTQLFTEVKAQEGTLAGGTKLGIGATALQELRETRTKLGDPRNDLIQLTPALQGYRGESNRTYEAADANTG